MPCGPKNGLALIWRPEAQGCTYEETRCVWGDPAGCGHRVSVSLSSTAAPARRHRPEPDAQTDGADDGEPSGRLAAEAGHVRVAAAARPERPNHPDAGGAKRAPSRAAACEAMSPICCTLCCFLGIGAENHRGARDLHRAGREITGSEPGKSPTTTGSTQMSPASVVNAMYVAASLQVTRQVSPPVSWDSITSWH
jgi:hypothetical protein